MGGAVVTTLWRRFQEPLVVFLAGGLLLLLIALPLGALTAQLMASGALATVVDTLTSPRLWLLLGTTLLQSSAITCVALLIGVPMGVLLAKSDVFLPKALLGLHVFPLFLPPLLMALGWSHIFGRQGWAGNQETSLLLFGRLGVVTILGLTFSPIVTALTFVGILRVPVALEDAALAVASPWAVIRGVLLPLTRPFIVLAAFVVFTLSLSEVAVPLFLRARTYSAAIFARLGSFSFRPAEAFALALPLLVLAGGLLWIERRWVRFDNGVVLPSRGARVYALGRRRIPLNMLLWSGVVFSLVPLFALGVQALGAADVFVWLGHTLYYSVFISGMSATLITALGVVLGHRLIRKKRAGGWLDGLAMFGFVTPAAVLGAGIVASWNRSGFQWVYGGVLIMVIGLAARYSMLGVRTIAAVMGRHTPSLEDAALVGGAGYLRRLFLLLMPLDRRGIGAAWLLALLFCLRDLETVSGFYPAGYETLPIRIFTLEANGSPALIAALAIIHVCLTAGVMLVAMIAGRVWTPR